MAWHLVHEEMQRRVVRRERLFRDRTHPLEVYDDVELVHRFRRADIFWLVDEFEGELEYDCAHRGGLSLLMEVMVALRIFAAGAFQLDVADTSGVSKPTDCAPCGHCAVTQATPVCAVRATRGRGPYESDIFQDGVLPKCNWLH